MAEPQSDSSCGSVVDGQPKVDTEEQSSLRRRSSSPAQATPCKLPRSHSPPPASTETACPGEERQADDSEEAVPTEAQSLGPNARRKSWRKSTKGRCSLPALPNPSQDLCKSIDPSLPQQERLEKLMEASMRLAVERTQRSLQSMPKASMEAFQKQVEGMQKDWGRLAEEIQNESQCLQTNTKSDPQMQKALEEIRQAIQRLQAESESWEALLNKHRNKAEELARSVEQGQDTGVTLDLTCLAQSSQSELIQAKPDYPGILRRQLPMLQTMTMVMDVQRKIIKELLSIQRQSQLLVKESSGRLAEDAGFQNLPADPVKSLMAVSVSSVTS